MGDFLSGEPKRFFEVASYPLSLGGKRLRPFTTFNCARLFGEPDDAVYYCAMAVELLHNFSLVHDDIMDEDRTRRGKPSLHAVYGVSMGILAGDLLFAEAFRAVTTAEHSARVRGLGSALAEASRNLDFGQYLDMSFEDRDDVTLDEYFEMISLKTASLNECSARLGGLVGGLEGKERHIADAKQLAAVASFGRNFGLAFQLRDDYLGVFGDPRLTGKPIESDIRRGKKTILVIRAMLKGSRSERRVLSRAVGNKRATKNQVEEARGVLRDLKVDRECQERSESYASAAVKSLTVFGASQAKDNLVNLAKYSALREK